MTRTPLLLALGAAAALAGCNKENHTIVAGATGRPTTTPPPTRPSRFRRRSSASKIYRCADNKHRLRRLAVGRQVGEHAHRQGGIPTQVAAAEAGKPMTAAGGYAVTGTSGG